MIPADPISTFDADLRIKLLPAPLTIAFALRVTEVADPVDSMDTVPTDAIAPETETAAADSIDTPPEPADNAPLWFTAPPASMSMNPFVEEIVCVAVKAPEP